MKPISTTLSALLALSMLAGCAPETKNSSSNAAPESKTNKEAVLAHGNTGKILLIP